MLPRRSISAIIVLVIVIFLACYNYEIWAQATEPIPKAQKEAAKPQDKKAEALPATQAAIGTAPVQPSSSIAEKNIFSPDRKDFPVRGGANKPIVRPQVVLYGVTIAGDYQAASVSNPGRALQKGEREIFTTKLGEKIGDYKVTNIASDRITLEADADRFEVLLYDSRTPKKRIEVKTETRPATITSVTTQPPATTPSTGTPAPSTPPVSAQAPTPARPPAAVTPSPPSSTTPPTPAPRTPTPYGLGTRGGRVPGTPAPTPQGGN